MSDIDLLLERALAEPIKKPVKTVPATPRHVKNRHKSEALSLIKRSVTASEPVIQGKASEYLEEAAGGRLALLETLQYCPQTSSGYKVAKKLIEDTAVRDLTVALTVFLQKGKLKFEHLAVAFRDSLNAQLAVQALAKLSTGAPTVLDQMITDAQNRYERCHVCAGKGRIPRLGDDNEFMFDKDGEPVTQLCFNCRGQGEVYLKHDVQDRKQYLQVVGLLKDRGDVTFNNVQQSAVIGKDFQPGDGSFERLIKAVDLAISPQASKDEAVDVPFSIYEKESTDPTTELSGQNTE